jgi:hypothetical protein
MAMEVSNAGAGLFGFGRSERRSCMGAEAMPAGSPCPHGIGGVCAAAYIAQMQEQGIPVKPGQGILALPHFW